MSNPVLQGIPQIPMVRETKKGRVSEMRAYAYPGLDGAFFIRVGAVVGETKTVYRGWGRTQFIEEMNELAEMLADELFSAATKRKGTK